MFLGKNQSPSASDGGRLESSVALRSVLDGFVSERMLEEEQHGTSVNEYDLASVQPVVPLLWPGCHWGMRSMAGCKW